MRKTLVATAVAILTMTACGDSITGSGYPDFEGIYEYDGTVDDVPGDAVAGRITITQQIRGRARVTLDWRYQQGFETTLHVSSDQPADAVIDRDGSISFDFAGDIAIDGDDVSFTLTHDGRLKGHTMTGTWRLTTGLPTDDQGSFIARR